MEIFKAILIAATVMMISAYSPRISEAEVARKTTADKVVIDKSTREITLYSGVTPIRNYRVAFGAQPVGRKLCRGDNRTPEGDYVITGRNSASRYHLSLRISYPNIEDRKRSRAAGCDPGGDIMIHGLPNGTGWMADFYLNRDWTLGCIAVTDAEIEEIWELVPNGTPIQIIP